MLLYKITGIWIILTIALCMLIGLYYSGNPSAYRRALKSHDFDGLALTGIMILGSVALALISAVRFIILL